MKFILGLAAVAFLSSCTGPLLDKMTETSNKMDQTNKKMDEMTERLKATNDVSEDIKIGQRILGAFDVQGTWQGLGDKSMTCRTAFTYLMNAKESDVGEYLAMAGYTLKAYVEPALAKIVGGEVRGFIPNVTAVGDAKERVHVDLGDRKWLLAQSSPERFDAMLCSVERTLQAIAYAFEVSRLPNGEPLDDQTMNDLRARLPRLIHAATALFGAASTKYFAGNPQAKRFYLDEIAVAEAHSRVPAILENIKAQKIAATKKTFEAQGVALGLSGDQLQAFIDAGVASSQPKIEEEVRNAEPQVRTKAEQGAMAQMAAGRQEIGKVVKALWRKLDNGHTIKPDGRAGLVLLLKIRLDQDWQLLGE